MVSQIYCSKKSLHFHLFLVCPCHDSASSKVVVCHEGIIGPLREHPLVKIHEDGILLCDLSIEDALHVPVCAQTILDVSSSSCLCPQLHRLEPVNILPVEEHKPHCADTLVDVEGVPGENCPLDHNSVRIRREQRASCKQ